MRNFSPIFHNLRYRPLDAVDEQLREFGFPLAGIPMHFKNEQFELAVVHRVEPVDGFGDVTWRAAHKGHCIRTGFFAVSRRITSPCARPGWVLKNTATCKTKLSGVTGTPLNPFF